MDVARRCPCGTGERFGECCGRYLGGIAAPTAETLMRSRYTAFCVGDVEYLRATWDESTRPADLDLDEDLRWIGLDIVATERGRLIDDTGIVEFRAHYRHDGDRGTLHERSRFRRVDGWWYYLDGEVDDRPSA